MTVKPPLSSPSHRLLAQQALSRAAGAPLIAGNAVELLIDAAAHYARTTSSATTPWAANFATR
jgi:cardiolipin synthase